MSTHTYKPFAFYLFSMSRASGIRSRSGRLWDAGPSPWAGGGEARGARASSPRRPGVEQEAGQPAETPGPGSVHAEGGRRRGPRGPAGVARRSTCRLRARVQRRPRPPGLPEVPPRARGRGFRFRSSWRRRPRRPGRAAWGWRRRWAPSTRRWGPAAAPCGSRRRAPATCAPATSWRRGARSGPASGTSRWAGRRGRGRGRA